MNFLFHESNEFLVQVILWHGDVILVSFLLP